MERKTTEYKKPPIAIPMEPAHYTFLLEAICDKKQKKCLKSALIKYHKSCAKAYRQLMKDLEKCL